jgi:hypothetical protein
MITDAGGPGINRPAGSKPDAIPAAGVVRIRGQGAVLNVTVLELPPAGVAIS